MEELKSCKALDWEQRVAHNVAPNDIKFLDPMIGVLICKRSDKGEDFSVSEGGLNYCIELEDQKAGTQCYVLLVDRDGSFIAQTTVRDFRRRVNGIVARTTEDSKYGPYWWIDERFNYAGSLSGNIYVSQAPWL